MNSKAQYNNPFPGLRPFKTSESHLFFGRDDQTKDLIERLAQSKMLAVIGSSGSGKSSLVRCGLLGRIPKAFSTDSKILSLRPENSPLKHFVASITDAYQLDSETSLKLEAAVNQPTLFAEQLQTVISTPSFFFIDQFEEVFRFDRAKNRQAEARAETKTFIRLLLHLYQQETLPIYIIFTIRSDFLGNCAQYQGFAEAINKGQYLVPKMNQADLRAVIEKPIAWAGATIAPELTERLLNELGNNPDQLPILQHALMRSWDYWSYQNIPNTPISEEHYEAIGTMEYALSQHADEAFGELDTQREQRICELMFKAITDKGVDNKGVRRPLGLQTICAITQASLEEVTDVIDVFRKTGRSFIMPAAEIDLTEDTVIDIAHESLIRIWTKLMMWADEEASSAETYISLAKAAALYQNNRSGVWRDPELQLALSWYQKNQPNGDWANRYDPSFERAIAFLNYSKQQRDFELEESEKRQQERLRRTRLLAGVMSFLTIMAVIATLFALINQTKAQENAKKAFKNQVVAEEKTEEAQKSAEIAQKKSEEARIAADEARAKQRIVEQQILELSKKDKIVKAQLNQLLQQKKELEANRQKLEKAYEGLLASKEEEERQRALAELKAIEANEERVKAIDASIKAIREQAIADSLRNLTQAVAMAINSGRMLDEGLNELAQEEVLQAYRLYRSNNGTPENPFIFNALYRIWDTKLESTADVHLEHNTPVRGLATASRRKFIATADEGGVVFVKKEDGTTYNKLNLKKRVRTLKFTADEAYLLIGMVNGELILWEYLKGNDKNSFRVLESTGEIIHSLHTFEQDEKNYIAFATNSKLVFANLTKNDFRPIATLERNNIVRMSVSSDGQKLVLAGKKSLLLFYPDFSSTNILKILENYVAIPIEDVTAVNFSPKGDKLGVGNSKGFVWILNTDDPYITTAFILNQEKGHQSIIANIIFDKKGEQVASAGLDGTVRLWDSRDFLNREEVILQKHLSWVWDIAYLNNRLYSIGDDRQVIKWYTKTEDLVKALQ